MATPCLLCNKPDPNYKPRKGADSVCSRCVMKLLLASQESIQKAIVLAYEKGAERQRIALEMFKEETDGAVNTRRDTKKRTNRGGVERVARFKRIPDWQAQTKWGSHLRKGDDSD